MYAFVLRASHDMVSIGFNVFFQIVCFLPAPPESSSSATICGGGPFCCCCWPRACAPSDSDA